jgi:hypothetical protein
LTAVEVALVGGGVFGGNVGCFQDGVLVGAGTHDELCLRDDGLRRRLAKLQFNLKPEA